MWFLRNCAIVLIFLTASTASYSFSNEDNKLCPPCGDKAFNCLDVCKKQRHTKRPLSGVLSSISAEVSDVVHTAKKALVFVEVTREYSELDMDILRHFFGYPPRNPPKNRQQKVSGSGFFIDLDEGYIVTNTHVIKDGKYIQVTLANGDIHEAEVVGKDESSDIAVIKVGTEDFRRDDLDQLELDDSGDLRTGEFVIALGAPFGLKASVSLGIVSGLGRGIPGMVSFSSFIQTDAAINPGNSGGPLLNTNGKVVGVNSAIYSVSGGYDGIGLAVPADIVQKVSKQLITSGEFKRGYVGVQLQVLEADMRPSFQLKPDETGVLIANVVAGAPAESSGLKAGDVILSIDGQKVATPFEVASLIGFKSPGSVVKVSYIRKGKRKTVEIELTHYEDEKTKNAAKQNRKIWGLDLEELAADHDRKNDSSVSILVKGSENLKSDILPGDIIVAVDNIKIQNLKWFESYVENKKEVVLYIERNGQYMFVTLKRS